MTPAYAELQTTSNFSFLRGGSHPHELVAAAAELGLAALAVTDHNTLAGVVRAHSAAKELGVRFVVGARLDFADGTPSVLCYPTDRAAYGRLSKMLSAGQLRTEKGECELTYADLLEHGQGQVLIVVPPRQVETIAGSHARRERDDIPLPPRGGGGRRTPIAPGISFPDALLRFACDFPGQAHLAASRTYGAQDAKRLSRLAALAAHTGTPLVATGDALYHHPARRPLQDVLTCIREKCTIHEAGLRLDANAERHLKPPAEMARLFAAHPDAVARTIEIVERCGFSLAELRYEYPDEPVPPGKSAQQHLEDLTWAGAATRYPQGAPAEVQAALRKELAFIAERNLPHYFLTVHDIVRFAREECDPPILCQGRGSAANSAVCYCLGVTAVDPTETKLLFERFMSKERDEPPDIDVDFEHERREEVIQYIYRRYGRERAALTATVIHYRPRSAIRDVGKALGLTEDVTAALANTVWGSWGGRGDGASEEELVSTKAATESTSVPLPPRGGGDRGEGRRRSRPPTRGEGDVFPTSETSSALSLQESASPASTPGRGSGIPDAHIRQAGLDPSNPEVRRAVDLAGELLGFPRHLSQHVGGFVLTKHRLDETVPIGNAAMEDRTVIEWDKDDIDALGLMKVDVLALGMLTCIRRALELLAKHHGVAFTDIAQIPAEDKAVYDMLSRGDSVGVFQVESRAQMSMLPRLKPKTFYDLVIEVAIVRPGPIQGDMVHPYLRRRDGLEPVEFPSPAPEHGPPDELERILGRTKGVPLFQEQAMSIAIEAAKFTPEEANGLRRAMATFRSNGTIYRYKDKFISRMIARGYAPEFAERCFKQIEGFGSYGFPESHAASFAKLVYASAWIKHHYPDVFCAAILNSQPMGFYQPAQLARDAREHGVEVRPPDAWMSDWDCTLEESGSALPSERRKEQERSGSTPAAGDPGEEAGAGARATRDPGSQSPSGPRRLKAVRLGLRMVDGLAQAEAEKLIAARARGAQSLEALAREAGLARGVLERIAEADAFRSKRLDRRAALWRASGLKGERTIAAEAPLLAQLSPQTDESVEDGVVLPPMPLPEHVAEDYRTIGLSLKAHPCAFFRRALAKKGVLAAADLAQARAGATVRVAGLVLNRQRPGTAKNVMFATLEDETGIANLVIWDRIFQAQRRVLMTSGFLLVEGEVQKASGVIHVIVARSFDLTASLARLRGDAGTAAALQKSRDFH